MVEQFLSSNRIIGELPKEVKLGSTQVKIPNQLSRSSTTVSLSKDKGIVKSSFIHECIGYILNSQRLEDPNVSLKELGKAIDSLDKTCSSFIKESILKKPNRISFVAFSQTSENVATDELLISEETYNSLVGHNSIWEKCERVIVTRYPNLGPDTTISLKLVVNKSLTPHNPVMFEALKGITIEPVSSKVGCVYLHQDILKGCLEGDSDGDMIFMSFQKKGRPTFKEVNLNREQGVIEEDDINTLLRKSRVNRERNEQAYLASKIDKVPIGKTTYAIKWSLFYKTFVSDAIQPLHKVWKHKVSKWGLGKVEFAMDIRKGEFTEYEIERNLAEIDSITSEINYNKKQGNWFALTVTSPSVKDIGGFMKSFPTAQSFLNYCQKIKQ